MTREEAEKMASELDGKLHAYYGLGLTVPEELVRKRQKILAGALQKVAGSEHTRLLAASRELLRVLDMHDPPDMGYIFDANEAECLGCQHKAATIETIAHDVDCLNLAMNNVRAAIESKEPHA